MFENHEALSEEMQKPCTHQLDTTNPGIPTSEQEPVNEAASGVSSAECKQKSDDELEFHEDSISSSDRTKVTSVKRKDISFETCELDGEPILNAITEMAENVQEIQQRQKYELASAKKALSEKDAMLEALQRSLEDARKDQVSTFLTPLVRRLVELHSQAVDASLKDYTELDVGRIASQINSEFEYFAEGLLEAIENLGFVNVEASVGTPFNARSHNAVGKEPTGDLALDKTIANCYKPGFTFGDSKRVAFPARVTVYEFDEEYVDAAGTSD